LVNWLTTVVDSLAIQERYKDVGCFTRKAG